MLTLNFTMKQAQPAVHAALQVFLPPAVDLWLGGSRVPPPCPGSLHHGPQEAPQLPDRSGQREPPGDPHSRPGGATHDPLPTP